MILIPIVALLFLAFVNGCAAKDGYEVGEPGISHLLVINTAVLVVIALVIGMELTR